MGLSVHTGSKNNSSRCDIRGKSLWKSIVSSFNVSENTYNYGKTTKIDYGKGKKLVKQPNFRSFTYSNFPKIVGDEAKPLSYLKEFVMKEQFHKDVLVKYIPALNAMGEEAGLAELASGKYKIILEPWVVVLINVTYRKILRRDRKRKY